MRSCKEQRARRPLALRGDIGFRRDLPGDDSGHQRYTIMDSRDSAELDRLRVHSLVRMDKSALFLKM